MVTADTLSLLSPMDEFEVSDMNVKVHHLIRITPGKMEEFKEETAKDEWHSSSGNLIIQLSNANPQCPTLTEAEKGPRKSHG